METRILVADDDRDIARLVAETLTDEGFRVEVAQNGREALQILEEAPIGLAILDIMMPEMDGLEVCRRIRYRTGAPIILLSAKDRELDKVVGLEVGADDYVTKPFSVNELVARVKAHLRRESRKGAAPDGQSGLALRDLRIRKDTYELFKGGAKIELSTKEFQILVYLAENKDLVLTREQIYDAVWGYGDYGDINTVTVHIKNLRAKLGEGYIKTVWGAGYKFVGGAGT